MTAEEDVTEAEEERVFGKLNRLLKVVNEQKEDRGLVLTLAAFSEEALGRLIEAYLHDEKAAKSLVEGFNAPLGSFSTRILAARALGLISEEQYSDLEKLRKIRNEFAHTWDRISLSRASMTDRVSAMTPSRVTNVDAEASTFIKLRDSVTSLLIEVEVAAAEASEHRLPARSRRLTGESKPRRRKPPARSK